MPLVVDVTDKIPEDQLFDQIAIGSDFGALVATAYRDKAGTFTLELISLVNSDDAGASGELVISGKMSTFGGPHDPGVGNDEGLALFDGSDVAANPDIFLPQQPPGTTGTAKRLNPDTKYLACRWTYAVTSKNFLKNKTTKAKVTNPSNNRSAFARPADWGPNANTGRSADLSLGLATELGLETNDICKVELPLPGGAAPELGTGVGEGFDLVAAENNEVVLPNDTSRKLVVLTTSNEATYWVVTHVGPDSGGQTLFRRASGATEALLSDTAVLPVETSDKIPEAVADELNKAVPDKVAAPQGAAGQPPGANDNINSKLFGAATAFVGHDTANAPDTDNGNLACAWAINEVTRRAFGKPISKGGRDGNGLSTIGIAEALEAHHTRLVSAAQAVAGTIIIAPTIGSRHGHVGIVGNNSQVFSNSSGHHKFEQNYTVTKFTEHYTASPLRLEILFYALKREFFV